MVTIRRPGDDPITREVSGLERTEWLGEAKSCIPYRGKGRLCCVVECKLESTM